MCAIQYIQSVCWTCLFKHFVYQLSRRILLRYIMVANPLAPPFDMSLLSCRQPVVGYLNLIVPCISLPSTVVCFPPISFIRA